MQGCNGITREALRRIISEAVKSVVSDDDVEYVEAEEVLDDNEDGRNPFDRIIGHINQYKSMLSWKFRVRYQNDDAKFGKNEFFGGQGDDDGDKARMKELVESLVDTAMEKNLIFIIVSVIKGYNKGTARTIAQWGNIPGRWMTKEDIEDCERNPLRYIDISAKGSYVHVGSVDSVAKL